MRHPEDVDAFALEIGKTAELFGEAVSEARVLLYFEALADLPLSSVIAALRVARRTETFFPKPGQLRALAPGLGDGHPEPEEAWALVAGLTEADTVVWTDEVAAAWGVASGVLPDRVGARMAFLEFYRRTLGNARSAGAPPRWWASLGLDPHGRPSPVAEAVRIGKLSASQARALLPPEAWPVECRPALPEHRENSKALVAKLTQTLATKEGRETDG